MEKKIYWSKEKKEKAISIILSEIEEGKSTRSILANRDKELLPSRKTFMEWLRDDKALSDQYARSMEVRADKIFDEIIEISDHTDQDHTAFTGSNVVQRDRLRIDARKWALSKMNPKKYGDKIDMTTNGENISPVIIDWSGDKTK